jgi:hypothetical protein
MSVSDRGFLCVITVNSVLQTRAEKCICPCVFIKSPGLLNFITGVFTVINTTEFA